MNTIIEYHKCPTCNEELHFIYNYRMDDIVEKIPACDKCKAAFRDPKLGFELFYSEDE